MTKVVCDESILDYQREMAETVREVIRSQYIAGVKVWDVPDSGETLLDHVDLLPPPGIEAIALMVYEGKVDDLIFVATSSDFGVWHVHITIMDHRGKLIESGNAFEDPIGSGEWFYFGKVAIPSGTTVTVHVAATDRLGGVAALSESTTIL
jgi:hypothetical protein